MWTSTLFLAMFGVSLVAGLPGVENFRCGDGAMVALRTACDGTVNCKDGSDEGVAMCSKSRCWSKRWFRCNYGACIPRRKKCDGRKDCRDGSDEANCGEQVGSCGLSQWRCSTGVCIPLRAACNGTTECEDKSDETEDMCKNSKCTSLMFKCDYGACIPRNLTCDGEPHCSDNSDERPALCGTGCKIPRVSPPLQVSIGGCKDTLSCSSDRVPNLGTISFTCAQGYSLQGEQFLFCVENKFQPPDLPICVPVTEGGGDGTCRGLADVKPEVEVTCSLSSGEETSCTRPQKVGNVARFQCRQNSQQYSEAKCEDGGKWSATPPVCEPTCGIAGPSAYKTRTWATPASSAGIVPNIGLNSSSRISRTSLPGNAGLFRDVGPLIVHGQDAFPGQWPWHAGLYLNQQKNKNDTSEWKYQCGGTLVSDTAVVTAGHCVLRRPADRLMITLGKFQRDYNASEPDTQYIKVREVYLPETYVGELNFYDSDIAVLALSERANFGPKIRPACLDWSQSVVTTQLTEGSTGVLAGWGVTEDDKEAESLKYTRLNFVTLTSCITTVPSDFKKFLKATTFCAGFFNGTAACNGDSGGGLHFPLGPESPQTPWILQGVVSVSVRKLGDLLCAPDYPGVFTRVANFMDFVVPNMKKSAEAQLN